MAAAAGLNDPDAVDILTKEASERVKALLALCATSTWTHGLAPPLPASCATAGAAS